MAFNFDTWKTRLHQQMPGWQLRMHQAGIGSIYAFLSAATVWPIVEAMQRGEWAAMSALGGVVAGVGSNLLANAIQDWKDEAGGAQKLEDLIGSNDELRAEIDAVLEELGTLDEAYTALPDSEQQWFATTLQDELAKLGNLARFQATITGAGAIAQGPGSVALGAGATYTKGDYHYHEAPKQPIDTSPDPLQRYLAMLISDCNQLDSLAALSFDVEDTTQITLEQVYIDLNTTDTVPLNDEEQEHRERFAGRDERPLPALEACAKSQQMVLLGDPGGGKSSFVRHLAVQLAAAALAPDKHPPPAGWQREEGQAVIPLLTILRDLGPKLAELDLEGRSFRNKQALLREAVWSQWREDLQQLGAPQFADQLEDLLSAGRILLIFDGLDEVAAIRPRLYQAILAVKAAYNESLAVPEGASRGPDHRHLSHTLLSNR